MLTINNKFVIAMSNTLGGPVMDAIRSATEVGVVVPSLLVSALEKAQCRLVWSQGDKLARVDVMSWDIPNPCDIAGYIPIVEKQENLIARGGAEDQKEALLAAILGYCRERLLYCSRPEAVDILASDELSSLLSDAWREALAQKVAAQID